MSLRPLAAALLLALTALTVNAYCPGDSLKALFGSPDADPVEGIWQLAPEGAVIAIEADGRGTYSIFLVDAPAPALLPGTLIGGLARTAAANTYDGRISLPEGPDTRLTAELDPRCGTLQFYKYRQRAALNLWKLVPRLFRYSVAWEDTRPEGIDGALRLYPRPAILTPIPL